MSIKPRIGLIVPPVHGRVPRDATTLYGERYEFIARGLGVGGISPEGFASVIDTVLDRAYELRAAGAQAISMMGTSISFYRGSEFTEAMRTAMQEATGVPCTTMSHAIAAALRKLGIRRVAVATSYIEELNDRLVDFLAEQGFVVTAIEGLGISEVGGAAEVSTQDLFALSKKAYEKSSDAEGIFISCGGLVTLDAIRHLEEDLGVPAVASSPAGCWDVVRAGGWDARTAGAGRLLGYP